MLTCYLLNGTLLAKTWTVAPLVASGLVSFPVVYLDN